MSEEDLFSNKLLALLNRKAITNRDIFDIWFFLSK
ncbi:MAG: nucleotidyl transferase AbiEii/AbiGii toxin family protein [Candidatus Peribacteria bacterium]|nr:nucleotidyl transferase AbiEii/AbiGii toxin family protein [Candidatus Peribacteria bacterium]